MDLISHSHWLAITKQRKSTKKITNEDLGKKTSAHKLIFGQNLRSAFPSTGIGNPFTNTTELKPSLLQVSGKF